MNLQEQKKDLPGFMTALCYWLASQSPDPHVAVAGLAKILVEMLVLLGNNKEELNGMLASIALFIVEKGRELGNKRWGG
jgi:hypothetical protein